MSSSASSKEKENQKIINETVRNTSEIDQSQYDADKIIILESGAVYMLDENDLVKAFQLPGKPIRFLTEQEGIEFNERLNKHMANRDLNNVTSDKSATQEYKKSASIDSNTNNTTPPPKPPRTYEYRAGDINNNDSQVPNLPPHDYNHSESKLTGTKSRKQVQPTSSLDHILKEDKTMAEKVGISLQHTVHHTSAQLTQKSHRSSRIVKNRNSKNSTRSR